MTASDQDGHAIQLRFASVLLRVGSLAVVFGPPSLLGERNAARLRTQIGQISYPAYVFRHEGSAALVVPDSVCVRAGLEVGACVEPRVRLKLPRLPRRVPEDVREVLDAARVDIATLSEADRRQSLMLIGEAKNPSVRRARTAALIAACRRQHHPPAVDVAPVPTAAAAAGDGRRALEPARS